MQNQILYIMPVSHVAATISQTGRIEHPAVARAWFCVVSPKEGKRRLASREGLEGGAVFSTNRRSCPRAGRDCLGRSAGLVARRQADVA